MLYARGMKLLPLALVLVALPAAAEPPRSVGPALTRVDRPAVVFPVTELPDLPSSEIVADNVRATGPLYMASMLDELKLFDVVDRLVELASSGQLPIGGASRERLDAYAKRRGDRVSATARADLGRFGREPVRSVFNAVVTSSLEQMEAYAALVQAVSESLDAFRKDNTTGDGGRDYLADRPGAIWNAAHDLALSLSHHGSGSARFAATQIEQQRVEALAILSDPAVLAASGVKSRAELVAKHGGRTVADVERVERRAETGGRLIASLADSAALLDTPAKKDELARKVAPLGPQARAWLSVKLPRSTLATQTVRPLCFDAKRTLGPCAVRRR